MTRSPWASKSACSARRNASESLLRAPRGRPGPGGPPGRKRVSAMAGAYAQAVVRSATHPDAASFFEHRVSSATMWRFSESPVLASFSWRKLRR